MHLEKLSLNLLSSSLCNPSISYPSLTILVPYGLLRSLWCFSILENYYFEVSFNLNALFVRGQITQSAVTSRHHSGTVVYVLD